MRIVLDTSVIAKFFLTEKDADYAQHLLRAIGQGKLEVHTSDLIWFELSNVLVKYCPCSDIALHNMNVFQRMVDRGFIIVHPSTAELRKIAIEIAFTDTKSQGNVSLYDATFHALALHLDVMLITSDLRHIQKTEKIVGNVVELRSLNIP